MHFHSRTLTAWVMSGLLSHAGRSIRLTPQSRPDSGHGATSAECQGADKASHRLCVGMYTRGSDTVHRAPKHASARPRWKLSVPTGPKLPDRAPGYGAFCGIMVMPVGPTPVNWTITSPSFAHA